MNACMTTASMALIRATTHPKMQVDRPCRTWAVTVFRSFSRPCADRGGHKSFPLFFPFRRSAPPPRPGAGLCKALAPQGLPGTQWGRLVCVAVCFCKSLLKVKLLEGRPESAMFSQVVRVIEKDGAAYEYGCRFLELTEADQEQITQNIFAVQRQKRGRS